MVSHLSLALRARDRSLSSVVVIIRHPSIVIRPLLRSSVVVVVLRHRLRDRRTVPSIDVRPIDAFVHDPSRVAFAEFCHRAVDADVDLTMGAGTMGRRRTTDDDGRSVGRSLDAVGRSLDAVGRSLDARRTPRDVFMRARASEDARRARNTKTEANIGAHRGTWSGAL